MSAARLRRAWTVESALRNPWLWVAGLTLLGFLLRRLHLGFESLWFDEADLVAQARQPLGTLLEGFARAGENGPLYTLLMHFWLALYDGVGVAARAMHLLFGASYEAPVRGPAMLFGTASIPAIYLLGRKVSGGVALGLVAAALLAANPFHLWYSQDAKMYTLLVLLTIITSLLYMRALERNTPAAWAAYVLLTWVMLTSHSLSGLVVLAHLVATPFLLRDRPQHAQARRPPYGLVAFVVLALPVLPVVWLRAAALLTGTFESGNWYSSTSLPDVLLTIFVKFAVNQAAPTEIMQTGLSVPWEAIGASTMGLLALVGAFGLLRRRPENAPATGAGGGGETGPTALAVLLWVVPVLIFGVATTFLPLFHPRYLIMALPSYLVAAGSGLILLWRWKPVAALLAVLLLAAAQSAALLSVNYSPQPQKEDWRGAMAYVQDHLRIRDVIVPFPGYLQSAVKLYYTPGGPGQVPDRPVETVKSLRTEDYGEREMEDELRRIAQCNERAWLIISPARAGIEDRQGKVLQWFQYNFLTFDTRVFNGITVYGISFNSVYNCWVPNPDYLEPHTFENGLEFLGYIYELRDQSERPVQPDASYLPLTLYWRANGAMQTSYQVRIRVLDQGGQVVKDEALGPLNGYFPTTQWHPAVTLMDYRDVRLPGGLSPGDYRVTLQVYPQGKPDEPLKLRGEEGDTITLNEPVRVVPWQP